MIAKYFDDTLNKWRDGNILDLWSNTKELYGGNPSADLPAVFVKIVIQSLKELEKRRCSSSPDSCFIIFNQPLIPENRIHLKAMLG